MWAFCEKFHNIFFVGTFPTTRKGVLISAPSVDREASVAGCSVDVVFHATEVPHNNVFAIAKHLMQEKIFAIRNALECSICPIENYTLTHRKTNAIADKRLVHLAELVTHALPPMLFRTHGCTHT